MLYWVEPKIGFWYKKRGEDRRFEVVAVDCHDGSIEVQYADDGEVEELSPDSWNETQPTEMMEEDSPADLFESLDSVYDTDDENDENFGWWEEAGLRIRNEHVQRLLHEQGDLPTEINESDFYDDT